MNLENLKSRALKSWVTVGLLTVLCLVLASLQYVWIGELSRGERARLQEGLQSSVQRLSLDFNEELSRMVVALRPSTEAVDANGREAAYTASLHRWRETATYPGILKRVGVAVPSGQTLNILTYDEAAESFRPGQWPQDWVAMRDALARRIFERRGGPMPVHNAALIEIPRFPRRPEGPGPGPAMLGGPGSEVEWLLVELDQEFLRANFLPTLIARHIGTGMPLHVRVFDRLDTANIIFNPSNTAEFPPDATAGLLEINRFDFGGGRRPPPPPPGGDPRAKKAKGVFFRAAPLPPDFNRGRWQIDVQYASGSLDSIVSRLRWRNLGISAAILGLMLFTAIVLVRFSRQQQHLAELQMNFVAGVSHELRTPLTVIRTAAYNLRGRVAANPAQVERYGGLIQDESEKLTALVEQVLRFSSARAGHAVGEKSPVAIEGVIEEGLHSRRLGVPGSPIVIEKELEEHLPLVMADELALKHAIQNLLDNAVKYGTENSDWIGVSARKVIGANGDAVEVRVADHGPGIPAEEQAEIFNPFFRGRRAQQDQIHGTGLGLNLVKKIVEAHGGTIRVESEPGHGTAFIIRIPAAPAELQDEFAHTAG